MIVSNLDQIHEYANDYLIMKMGLTPCSELLQVQNNSGKTQFDMKG